MTRFQRLACRIAAALLAAPLAHADDAAIRKNIAEHQPQLGTLDEISKTPIPGLVELRFGTTVIYSDEQGLTLLEGSMVDTRTGKNLTEARIDKLTAINFASLPFKDAMVWKQGTGERKLAVFADPNCGYCKRFERDLQQIKDVTVYTFLYPVLGEDSVAKSKAIWCSKDNTKTWRDWMLGGAQPPAAMGSCDVNALARNAQFGRKYRVNGTPGLVFEDGKRVPGAMAPDALEKQLQASHKPG